MTLLLRPLGFNASSRDDGHFSTNVFSTLVISTLLSKLQLLPSFFNSLSFEESKGIKSLQALGNHSVPVSFKPSSPSFVGFGHSLGPFNISDSEEGARVRSCPRI